MINSTDSLFHENRSIPWYFLLVLILVFLAGLFIGQFLGLAIAILTTSTSINEAIYLASEPFTEDKRVPLLLIQGIGAIGGFILGGYFYLKFFTRINPFKLVQSENVSLWSIGQAFVIVISFMFVNTYFIEWNMNINFPDFLSGFETWAQQKEAELMVVTEFLTHFGSISEFILGFFVIAIVTAIGEELIFRGILQNQLNLYFKNIHISILVTAIIFSSFHLQFYGFVPRLLLGLLFGYMYHWSGNLIYPILAHFINNGFTIILVYLYRIEAINLDIESQEAYPVQILLAFGLIFIYMCYSFRKQFLKRAEQE